MGTSSWCDVWSKETCDGDLKSIPKGEACLQKVLMRKQQFFPIAWYGLREESTPDLGIGMGWLRGTRYSFLKSKLIGLAKASVVLISCDSRIVYKWLKDYYLKGIPKLINHICPSIFPGGLWVILLWVQEAVHHQETWTTTQKVATIPRITWNQRSILFSCGKHTRWVSLLHFHASP